MKQSGHVGAFYSILDPSAPLSGQTATQQDTNYLLNTAFVRTCLKKNDTHANLTFSPKRSLLINQTLATLTFCFLHRVYREPLTLINLTVDRQRTSKSSSSEFSVVIKSSWKLKKYCFVLIKTLTYILFILLHSAGIDKLHSRKTVAFCRGRVKQHVCVGFGLWFCQELKGKN